MAIDPGFLDELARLDASLKRRSDSPLQGQRDSESVGEGLTFSDYRRYAPGDDTRLVDWRVYARTEEYFVKRFEAERNLTVHVLVDASASMDYGEGDAHKFEFGAKIGLGFASLTAEENNDFRFSTVRERPYRLDAGRSNRGELLSVIDRLNETTPDGEAELAAAAAEYADTVRSRSLVVLVSDFLADPEEVAETVAALGDNDVLLVNVLAPGELDPGATGDTIFEDPESRETRRSYFGGSSARRYRDRLADHTDAVAERARDLRADYARLDTGEEFSEAFAAVWVG